MSDRIMLIVSGSEGIWLLDESAELSSGFAVSHKHQLAFGEFRTIPDWEFAVFGPSQLRPAQFGIGCVVDLHDKDSDEFITEIERAKIQYGPTSFDRWVRFFVMGSIGSWTKLCVAVFGSVFGYWPVIQATSGEGLLIGIVSIGIWSLFFVLVVARLFAETVYRQWGLGLVVAFALLLFTFFYVGDGISYIANIR